MGRTDGHAEAGSDVAGPPVVLQPQPSGVPVRNIDTGAPGSTGATTKGGSMPTDAKRATVAELTALFQASPSSIVADYRGLSVSEIGAVRRSLREKGIHYHVVKNRLAKIAADDAGVPELGALLQGPSAVAAGVDDESQLAKAFLDAVRPYKVVTIRGGVIRGRRIEAEDVTRLAELPSREVLLAQLAGAIASPLGTMAGLLSAPIRNLGGGLAQLAEQRGGSAGA